MSVIILVEYHVEEDLSEDNRLHSAEGSRDRSVRNGLESTLDPLRVLSSLELCTINTSALV